MNNLMNPEELLRQISQIQHMERGKLCVLRQGPKGPYYNHQSWEGGKNVARYVPHDRLAALQQAIQGYERFQDLVEQYTNLVVARTRAELASGSKKKPSHPTSSWPKTRKSGS
jgi:hypothetical protein